MVERDDDEEYSDELIDFFINFINSKRRRMKIGSSDGETKKKTKLSDSKSH